MSYTKELHIAQCDSFKAGRGPGVGVGVDSKTPTPESESTLMKTLSTPQPWSHRNHRVTGREEVKWQQKRNVIHERPRIDC